MAANVVFKISGGKTTFLVNEHTKAFMTENALVKRASHVEPVDWLNRMYFHDIRSAFGDDSWEAEKTRNWAVPWQVDLSPVGGPVLGPFNNRKDAIEAEIQYLNKTLLGV